MTQTVLILGASGKIGRHAGRAFEKAGWDVRLYDRQKGNMTSQAKGADVIVNGLNPKNYHNWDQFIPEISRDTIAAAKAAGATVILPGNVYVFGAQPGIWTEETPHKPAARKGHIRETCEAAYRASGVQTIVLRAGDFISGEAGDDDVMGLFYLRDIAHGNITRSSAPDTMHAFCYLPDWAEAARRLAERRAELPAFTDVNLGGCEFYGIGHPVRARNRTRQIAQTETIPVVGDARALSVLGACARTGRNALSL